MPSTTIHFPDDLLSDIDRATGELGVSRNRFVIEACRTALAEHAGEWPENFFTTGLSLADQKLLTESADEMLKMVYGARKNRGATLL